MYFAPLPYAREADVILLMMEEIDQQNVVSVYVGGGFRELTRLRVDWSAT